MSKTRPPYPAAYRGEHVRVDRTPEELARERERSTQTVRSWLRQAYPNECSPDDGPTTGEREPLTRVRREDKSSARSVRICQKPRLRSDKRPGGTVAVFEFVHQHWAERAVAVIRRLPAVSPSGTYAWCRRQLIDHEIANASLVNPIEAIGNRSRKTCAASRTQVHLRPTDGIVVDRKRVALSRPIGCTQSHSKTRLRTGHSRLHMCFPNSYCLGE